jgi:outer membrane protein TolC
MKSMNVKLTGMFVLLMIWLTGLTWAQEISPPLTLEESIRIALEQNLGLQSAMEGVKGSEFRTKAAWADFLARWTGQYSYTWYSDPVSLGVTRVAGFTGSRGQSNDVFNFSTTLNQPLFAGGAISSNYRLEKMGIDISKANVESIQRDVVLVTREGYFTILRAERFLDVARQAVKQFEAQLEVSKAFFDVGIVAKNDVLQAEVRLANAQQVLVVAESDLAKAKSNFNILLRRKVDAPLRIVDILVYNPFPLKFEESLDEALRLRPEVRAANLAIGQTQEAVKIARSELYPTISVAGNYNRLSDQATLSGDLSEDRWTIEGQATFTLFDWGKAINRVSESKVRVTQAEKAKSQLLDTITFEVKQAYLNLLQAEKNIGTAQKSIEQAEENLRMNEERYKYQVATQTDVLNAVTLLTQARTNYYGALSDFNVAKAQLERSMGKMVP